MPEIVYKNKFFNIEAMPLGKGKNKYTQYRINRPDDVIILAFVNKNEILMEEHYRVVVNKKLQELPAGMVDKNEKPEAAARRELEEETGYKAKNLKLLTTAYSSPGSLSTTSHFYLATGLYKGKVSLDGNEKLKVKRISFEKALKSALSSKGIDQKTVLGMMYYKLMV